MTEPNGAGMARAYAKHMEKHRRICAEERAEDARKEAALSAAAGAVDRAEVTRNQTQTRTTT